MNKDTLLKELAEDGYSIGIGANKSFATFDIVNSWLSGIALISLVVGIIQLKITDVALNDKISLILIIVSVIALHIANFVPDKEQYNKVGKRQIEIFHEIRGLYRAVKDAGEEDDFTEIIGKKKLLYAEFCEISLSGEIFMLTDLYSHFKFFGQKQVDWIDEQKKFEVWRDKIPNSLKLSAFVGVIVSVALYFYLR